MPQYFTPDEANDQLPKVIPLLEELRRLKAAIDVLNQTRMDMSPLPQQNGHASERGRFWTVQQQIEQHGAKFQTALDAVEELGVEVKDVDEGLIDFRGLRDGRDVYLCWRLGEDTVRFWHELDTGFPGRQPL